MSNLEAETGLALSAPVSHLALEVSRNLIPIHVCADAKCYFVVVTIYFSANAYIIDAFPGYVASALAAKTVVRSGSGAAMPLFITAMFHNLGNGWAASTWAFISLAMVSMIPRHMPRGSQLT